MAFVAQVSNVAYRPPVCRNDGRIIDCLFLLMNTEFEKNVSKSLKRNITLNGSCTLKF